MTRKDYIAIADVLRDEASRVSNHEPTRRHIAAGIARVLADDNPRFDRARFLKACGVEGAG